MEIGDIVAGRFQLEGIAGSGGMGVVYRALDRTTGARVALKAVRAGRPGLEDRFAREAVLLADLAHPSIVRYVAHGTHDPQHGAHGPESWLAMAWLDGEDLAARLGRGRLDVADALSVVTQAAAGLAAAHASGIVHRDIKPANLFLANGRIDGVRVLDFGIARLVDATRGLTATGVMIGTPGYVSPEQARGGDVDARTDVFALGCVLFECLTGRAAFTGNNVMALLAKILLEEAPRVRELRPDVPADVDDLVARMMAKEASGRLADGRAVVDAIGACRVTREVAGGDDDAPGAATPLGAVIAGREQRVQCVLLVGTTRAQSGALAPNDATEASDEIAPRLVRAAAAHGGRAEVLADGAVVVTFAAGPSQAATDVATRAARAALALQSIVPETSVVLASGRSELDGRAPTGEVIDRAAELVRRSTTQAHRRVRLDDVTAGLLAVRFDVADGAHEDEGWFLGEERGALEGSRQLVGKPTRCRGRDGELAMLAALLAQSVSEPMARVVLVTAPPGAGKSRLCREVVERARREHGDGVEILSARGDPMSAGSLFGLAGQLVRHAAGFHEGGPPAARHEKLRQYLATRVRSDLAVAASVAAEFLGELAGAPSVDEPSPQLRAARADPMIMGNQMRAAWDAWLAAECDARPVVIVLEDLHWGDLPSVQLIDGSLRSLVDKPLFVLALARPEVHERFKHLWVDRDLQELRLPAIGKRAAEALVRDILGEQTAPADVARVVERAATRSSSRSSSAPSLTGEARICPRRSSR